VRESIGSVDQVRVASGNAVLVFNISGNSCRLICAAHYDRGNLYTLRFLTHADYSKDRWKVSVTSSASGGKT
jgi:mRNA interferase HigB